MDEALLADPSAQFPKRKHRLVVRTDFLVCFREPDTTLQSVSTTALEQTPTIQSVPLEFLNPLVSHPRISKLGDPLGVPPHGQIRRTAISCGIICRTSYRFAIHTRYWQV